MKAIVTKYHGYTNSLPSRIGASTEGQRTRYYPYDQGLSADDNHRKAADLLAHELRWAGTRVGGTLPDGRVAWVKAGGMEGEFHVDDLPR